MHSVAFLLYFFCSDTALSGAQAWFLGRPNSVVPALHCRSHYSGITILPPTEVCSWQGARWKPNKTTLLQLHVRCWPKKNKVCLLDIHLPTFRADSRGPAAGAKERDLSQLPKFILINCEHITAAICTHLATSAGLASSSGRFYIQLSKPFPPPSMLEFQIPHASSALTLAKNLICLHQVPSQGLSFNLEIHKKLYCLLSPFSSYFTTSSYAFIHTHSTKTSPWDCRFRSIWTILGTNIKTSHSSHCLYPNLTFPSFCKDSVPTSTDWHKKKFRYVCAILINKYRRQ